MQCLHGSTNRHCIYQKSEQEADATKTSCNIDPTFLEESSLPRMRGILTPSPSETSAVVGSCQDKKNDKKREVACLPSCQLQVHGFSVQAHKNLNAES